ncbi:MAG: hypothetical protein SF069_09930 [Phycisphaerae bacterium]|nr:hypothetical protein [Phycisphaerae bacterium]
MFNIQYADAKSLRPDELLAFYRSVEFSLAPSSDQVARMLQDSDAVVTARHDGQLVGVARGVCDGVRGFLTECKLSPAYQGPAAVTRTDGRIEHDAHGIAKEMAGRVIAGLRKLGAQRIDALAWNTETDFLSELGFRKPGGLVGMTLPTTTTNATPARELAASAV